MEPRLKALFKELRENSGSCWHYPYTNRDCRSKIELNTVKKLINKHWPTGGPLVIIWPRNTPKEK